MASLITSSRSTKPVNYHLCVEMISIRCFFSTLLRFETTHQRKVAIVKKLKIYIFDNTLRFKVERIMLLIHISPGVLDISLV